jgi:hypothetical protein
MTAPLLTATVHCGVVVSARANTEDPAPTRSMCKAAETRIAKRPV